MTQSGTQNIFILDPTTTGHHREYLRHLAEACGRQTDGKATFRFFVDPSLVSELAGLGVTVDGLPVRAAERGQQLEHVLGKMGDTGGHLFLPRLNTYLEPLLGRGTPRLREQLLKARLSGIWFGPQSASLVYGGSIGKRIRGLMEILRIRRLKALAGLHRLYLLNDPKTAAALSQWTQLPGGVHPLADPVEEMRQPLEPIRGARTRLGLPEKDTLVFGMLGALREGKGIAETIRMLSKWKPTGSPQVILLVAGECLPAYRDKLDKALHEWKPASTQVSLHTRLERLSRKTFEDCLNASDFLLLPYRNVYNSSGLLGHSARTGRPVLASGSGLLGQLMRDFDLGVTLNPRSAKSLYRAMDAAMENRVRMDPQRAAAYLRENSVSAFQETLLEGFQES